MAVRCLDHGWHEPSQCPACKRQAAPALWAAVDAYIRLGTPAARHRLIETRDKYREVAS